VKDEAPPRQLIERSSGAPVERQKAARLAGGRTCDLVTLDDDRLCAASRGEIGNCGADRPPPQMTMRLRALMEGSN
jgi:hypothetical protein